MKLFNEGRALEPLDDDAAVEEALMVFLLCVDFVDIGARLLTCMDSDFPF